MTRMHNIELKLTISIRADAEFFERESARIGSPPMAVEFEVRSHLEDLGAGVFIGRGDYTIEDVPD